MNRDAKGSFKNNFAFCVDTATYLWPIFNRKILDVAHYACGFTQSDRPDLCHIVHSLYEVIFERTLKREDQVTVRPSRTRIRHCQNLGWGWTRDSMRQELSSRISNSGSTAAVISLAVRRGGPFSRTA